MKAPADGPENIGAPARGAAEKRAAGERPSASAMRLALKPGSAVPFSAARGGPALPANETCAVPAEVCELQISRFGAIPEEEKGIKGFGNLLSNTRNM